jgi:hypothetical protein
VPWTFSYIPRSLFTFFAATQFSFPKYHHRPLNALGRL